MPDGLLSRLAFLGSIQELPVCDDRKHCLARFEPLKARQNLRGPLAPDVDADVGVEKEARVHSQAFAVLGRSIVTPFRQKIIGQTCQNIECPRQALALLAQHDFIAPAENLDLLAPEAKLLGQADGLTVTGTKDFGDRHGTPAYTGMYIRQGARRFKIATCRA